MPRLDFRLVAKFQPRAVTFDATHTLIHPPRLADIYREVLERHGLEVDLMALRQQIPIVWQELSCQANPWQDRFSRHPEGCRGFWHHFLERVCLLCGIGKPTRFASAELFERFARADAWAVYPDVKEVLVALRGAGIKLGLISNWDERLPRLLERLELFDRWDAVAISTFVGCEKPNPRIFQYCVERLAAQPEEVLHIGDHPVEDVEGAEAAGLRAALLRRPRTSEATTPDDALRRVLKEYFPQLFREDAAQYSSRI